MYNKKEITKEKGITLVALAITIIIIIILSTITISTVLGDNGLIDTAKQTKEDAEDFVNTENDKMSGLLDEYSNIMAEPFKPQDTPEPETGGTEMSDMTNGVIEIKWLRGTSNYVTSTPNAPVIKTDLPSGTTMEQVVFDEANSTWIAGTEYSYVEGTGSSDNTLSKWANAKVTINGVESYFV